MLSRQAGLRLLQNFPRGRVARAEDTLTAFGFLDYRAMCMLVPFTVVVLLRALAMHEAGGAPFCAIKFDCGCGTGEVLICRKLAENLLLTALSVSLIFRRTNRLALRHRLF